MKKSQKKVFAAWSVVLIICLLISLVTFIKIKPMVFTYGKSMAKSIMYDNANKATINILDAYEISYDKLAVISRDAQNNFTGIEIDIEKLNRIKSEISCEISRLFDKKDLYELKIPVGTLLCNEYTTGFGPRLTFKMQLTQYSVVDFESKFVSAGLNQVLHQIIINIKINANILMIGCTEDFSATTSVIAAQTVIVGKVPDSFTSVEEGSDHEVADKIFNYADLK